MKPTANSPKPITAYIGQKFKFDSSLNLGTDGTLTRGSVLYNGNALILVSSKIALPDIVLKSMIEGAKNDGEQYIYGGTLMVTLDEALIKQLDITDKNSAVSMNTSESNEYEEYVFDCDCGEGG